ncbi:hypothetical protein [Burkholderia pyrrocinia]
MKVSMLLYPVDDIDTALPLFVDGLGPNVMFRDGDHYCALDGGPLTIALVARAEQIVERAALTLRVDEDDDLYAAMARAVKAGVSVRMPVRAARIPRGAGGQERRAAHDFAETAGMTMRGARAGIRAHHAWQVRYAGRDRASRIADDNRCLQAASRWPQESVPSSA